MRRRGSQLSRRGVPWWIRQRIACGIGEDGEARDGGLLPAAMRSFGGVRTWGEDMVCAEAVATKH
jgi:hypothetical protein